VLNELGSYSEHLHGWLSDAKTASEALEPEEMEMEDRISAEIAELYSADCVALEASIPALPSSPGR
jgi:hypothetical protein